MDGRQSSDPDGDSLLFQWSFASRPAESSIAPEDIDGQGEALAAFQPDAPGAWVLQLTVSDLSRSSTTALEELIIDQISWDGDLPSE
ncbi:MAG: hypothetical protein H6741_26660 [Alphaproteobacteria bacterium]|nr:hypothetical protein [Alphaproteobacteria bacterium]